MGVRAAAAAVCFWKITCGPFKDSQLNQMTSFLMSIINLINFEILEYQHNCFAPKSRHFAVLSVSSRFTVHPPQ